MKDVKDSGGEHSDISWGEKSWIWGIRGGLLAMGGITISDTRGLGLVGREVGQRDWA